MKTFKEKYTLLKRKLKTEDSLFLDKVYKDLKNNEEVIQNLHLQLDKLTIEKNNLKGDKKTLENNIEEISQQIIILEKENIVLNEQVKFYQEKITKLTLQMKSKQVVKVIKGGKIKHKLNESKKNENELYENYESNKSLNFLLNSSQAFNSNNVLIHEI